MSVELHPRVLELVASRICHDLVSPVGAVANGVELMQEMGADAGDEAVKLIESSAQQAGARLKVFRLCYGAAGTDANIGFKDVREAFTGLLVSDRVQAEFEPDIGAKLSMPPRGFLKCALNLFLLAEECNHGEGKIHVSAPEGHAGIKVRVTGRNAAFREGAEAALKGETPPDDLTPRSVHAYITGKFVAHFGLKLSWQARPELEGLEFQLAFPPADPATSA